MGLVAKIEKQRYITILVISGLVATVILVAIAEDKTDFTLEVLKIGGALLAGYLAGFNKGKANTLEKQQNQNQ